MGTPPEGMPRPEEPADQLGRAVAATSDLVRGVRGDQWSAPTPCPDWTVRDLVNHLTYGYRLFAGLVRGQQLPPLDELRRRQSEDQLGDDPAGAHEAAAQEMVAAFRQPGVLEQLVDSPIGTVPGAVLVHLRITEALTHGWDLARATGQSPQGLPADLAEQEIAFTRGALSQVPPERSPFAPPQPIADGAPAIDRLAALLGRAVPPA